MASYLPTQRITVTTTETRPAPGFVFFNNADIRARNVVSLRIKDLDNPSHRTIELVLDADCKGQIFNHRVSVESQYLAFDRVYREVTSACGPTEPFISAAPFWVVRASAIRSLAVWDFVDGTLEDPARMRWDLLVTLDRSGNNFPVKQSFYDETEAAAEYDRLRQNLTTALAGDD